jgi:hypothetical protein
MKRAFEIRSIVSPKKSLPIRVTAMFAWSRLHGVTLVPRSDPAISGDGWYSFVRTIKYDTFPLLVVARPAVVFAFPVTSLKISYAS